MPVFLEDPSEFSKERLKSELIAHNVALPPVESKKQEYLELYLKNVDTKNAADFSSDEEEELTVPVDSEQRAEEPDMRDLSGLTDEDLKAYLRQHGFQAGPITATTRYVYEKKLKRLMEPKSQAQKNGSEDKAVYSDSEEEENDADQEQPDPSLETVTCVEKEIANSEVEVPVTDVLMEIFPETEKTPTGIVATRRRPIKGAAGRPVKFKYPDLPRSPNTAGQQEVQRHKFPIWVQLLCFLIVTLLLFVTYLATEDILKGSLTLLLDNLNEVLAALSVEEAPLIADAAVPLLSGE